MIFQPYGPFELPRLNGGIDKRRKKAFWESVERENPLLPKAIGCYIFAMQSGKGFTPWYVGKTESQTFCEESWQPDKLLHYGNTIRECESGKPVLFLIAKCTPKGRFIKSAKRTFKSITYLEKMLIGTCLERNGRLLNKRDTRFLTTLKVPGYLNDQPSARSKNAKALAAVLGT